MFEDVSKLLESQEAPLSRDEAERLELLQAIKALLPSVGQYMAEKHACEATRTKNLFLPPRRKVMLWKVKGLPGLRRMHMSLWVGYTPTSTRLFLKEEYSGLFELADIEARSLVGMRRLYAQLKAMAPEQSAADVYKAPVG